MSGIAGLYNIPGTPEEFASWSFVHAAHHVDIAQAIYNVLKIAIPSYVLDPFDPNDPESAEQWSYLHQEVHRIQDEILGIAGFDLLSVDWQDANQRAAWIQLNADEHFQASNILEIG